jgi:hypothetical protein
MSVPESQAAAPRPSIRCFHLAPDLVVVGLLTAECLLWMSERFPWFRFNEDKGLTFLIEVAVIGTTLSLMLLWFIGSVIFRWRFQFSVRSLLVLVVVVAIPCSSLGEWLHRSLQHRKTLERIEDVLVELEDRYPDGVPSKHWDNALQWT